MTHLLVAAPSAMTRAKSEIDVVLVMMPFGPSRMPSLGLSMIAQVLRAAEVSVQVSYPLVDFIKAMGERDFDMISNAFGKLSLGEWLFSRAVDPVGSVEDFLSLSNESIRPAQVPVLRQLVEKAIPIAAKLVEDTAQRIVKLAPRIVGLSSSFQQQMASIALARRLRELMPDVIIVMGGANCSSPMGEAMFRAYPELDGVLVGPGEISFTQLVRAILDDEKNISIPGLYWRASSTTPLQDPGIAPEPKMDDLPFPYYDDFFEVWPLDTATPPMIPFEGSRGCWWGQKQHCVFCSLNHSITYRAKNPERLYSELVYLNDRFPGLQFFATDDILDHRIIGTITDRLAALPVRPKIFYSVKSNLKKDQLRALNEAGVNAILPGVESLADEVLTLMRKGVTGLRNLQLLKWSREFGLRVSWSILYGFPFDKAEYYQRMLDWLPSLTHLPAPRGLNDVRIQRYSPLYSQAEHFGVTNLRPRAVYSLIYNVSPELVEELAYNFDWDPPEDQSSYIDPLRVEVIGWMANEKSGASQLLFEETAGGMVIGDTRKVAPRAVYRLDPVDAAICLACDGVAKRHQIASVLEHAGHVLNAEALEQRLMRLVEGRLLIEHDDFFLFLAVPVPEDGPASSVAAIVQQMRAEVQQGPALVMA
ncbi:RiPP maturation radical SAM C-methyltransferase [Kordiimonas aestuarii]|uniref:RiPP maturation radical SAM C-methyltransferase n=1 Tax=Kordiimonas aestuarii TaxID=1005925 RepID=UPI0021D05186|nr:RiPP maturation radical SAM C-methyltransferase [Kordiimonas aestuarii]